MKYFLISALFAVFSNVALGQELYCETAEGKASQWADPKIFRPDVFGAYISFLHFYKFPYGFDKCGPEKYPELLKLFQFFQQPSEDAYQKSGFKFYETFSGKFILKEFESVSAVKFNEADFKNPLDAYRFIVFLKDKKLSNKIEKNNYKLLLDEYRADLELKKIAREKEFEARQKEQKEKQEAFQKTQRDLKDLENYKPKVENFKRYYYFSKIIEKGEGVLKDAEVFIKLKQADSVQDFKERLILACFEMNCNSKLKNRFSQENNNNLNFTINKRSPLFFSVFYNNFEEFKKIFDSMENFYVPAEVYSLSLHLKDEKIYQYIIHKDKTNLSSRNVFFDKDVLKTIIPINSLTKELMRSAKSGKSKRIGKDINFYSVYFMDRNRKFSPKHILGYSSAEFYLYPEQAARAKELNIKIDINEIPFYGFELPAWDAKKILLRDDKGDLQIKLEELSMKEGSRNFMFYNLSNYWISLNHDGKKVWVHSSQMENIEFIDQYYDESMGEPKLDALYDKVAGKKIPIEKSALFKKSIEMNYSKWVNNELWFNINLIDDENVEIQPDKNPVYDIWLKGFDNGKENFDYSSDGC